MTLIIDQKLLNFKNKVESNIDNMFQETSSLNEKINIISNVNRNVSTEISSNYQSENKTSILNKISKLDELLKKISTSLENDLTQILNETKIIIENIKKLEGLRLEVESETTKKNQLEIKNENSLFKTLTNEINSLALSINSKTGDFNKIQEETKSMLEKLKSKDSSLSFVDDFSNVEISDLTLQGGSFEKYSYTASNGLKMEYYMYVPDYGEDVENLPVHIYLHGAGEFGSGVLNQSLPAMLKKGYKPNGIVICPQGTDRSTWWNDLATEQAIIELTNNVVETYNADSNKISLSGHSQGAIGGYRLVTNYPDYFSAFIPISGHANKVESTKVKSGEAWNTLSKVKVWAFTGSNDTSVNPEYTKNAVRTLQQVGGDAYATIFYGLGHSIQNKVWQETQTHNGENVTSVLDWAFEQEKDG